MENTHKISLKTATIRIRQATQYAKYLEYKSDYGNERAMSIINDFHNGLYGSKNGMWVQINEAVEILEELYCK